MERDLDTASPRKLVSGTAPASVSPTTPQRFLPPGFSIRHPEELNHQPQLTPLRPAVPTSPDPVPLSSQRGPTQASDLACSSGRTWPTKKGAEAP